MDSEETEGVFRGQRDNFGKNTIPTGCPELTQAARIKCFAVHLQRCCTEVRKIIVY